MSVRNSGISPRARLTIAAVSMGAVALVVFLVLAFGSRIGGSIAASPNSQVADRHNSGVHRRAEPEEARKDALNKVSGLPLYFEANRGQVDPSVRYLARSGRYSLFLTDNAAVFSLIGGEFHKGPMPAGYPYKAGGETHLTESAVRVRLVGASPHPQVEGGDPLPGRVNYLIGAEKNWHRDIPTFGRVRFHNVYPGVDVVYYGSPSSLEYDFIAAPGADTSKIKFAIEGPAQTTQTASGDIVIATTSGVIRINKPQNYQQNPDGSRTPVAGSFTFAKDSTLAAGVPTRQVEFQLASYDRNRTLFIDPVVNTIPYSTYFGGNGSSVGPLNLEQFSTFLGKATLIDSETGVDVALDPSANAYITGTAYSNNLPTAGFFQSTLNGAHAAPNQNPNVFVAKFNTSLAKTASLIYATYIGANGNTKGTGDTGDGDLGFGIAVDTSGDAYVVGQTYSGQAGDSPRTVFPGTPSCGVWGQTNIGSNASTNQGFVTELLAGGDSLQYSCYIPGSHNATAARVALLPGCASNCDAYIVGSTQSTAGPVAAGGPDGFVVTGDAAQATLGTGEGGLSNAFIMRVAGGGPHPRLSIRVTTAEPAMVRRATSASAYRSNPPPTLPSPVALCQQHSSVNTSGAVWLPRQHNHQHGLRGYLQYDYRGADTTAVTSAVRGTETRWSRLATWAPQLCSMASNAWVGGLTASTNFPVSATPFESTNDAEAMAGPPATTGFVTELTPSSTSGLGQIDYSTYFGGTGFKVTIPLSVPSGLATRSARWRRAVGRFI